MRRSDTGILYSYMGTTKLFKIRSLQGPYGNKQALYSINHEASFLFPLEEVGREEEQGREGVRRACNRMGWTSRNVCLTHFMRSNDPLGL